MLLRDRQFDYAVSSDLSRACDTAAAIRGALPVARDPRWREFAFGDWEGLTWDEIVERSPHLREHGATAAKLYTPPGGESFEQVQLRVSAALHELLESRYENVLVVTHAGPLHAVLHAFFGDRRAEMEEALGVRFSPASVTRIRVEAGRADLQSLNETAGVL